MSVSKEAPAPVKQPHNLGVMQDSCQPVKRKTHSYAFFMSGLPSPCNMADC